MTPSAGGPAPLLRFWLPRRTVRARLALFYFVVFALSSAVLLAATVGLWQGRSSVAVSSRAVAVPRSAFGGTLPAQPSPAHAVPVPAHLALPQVVQHTSDLHQLLIAAALALALVAAFSVLLGWLVAGRFLAPLRAITTRTKAISATNLHERLNLAGPDDEIKELGDTFDDLLERLEQSFDFERQFVANASHELRTPLATMRASLDVAMAKPGPVPAQTQVLAERLRRELDQVDKLLESFLTLSQAQRGPALDEATVSLDAAAAAAIARRASSIELMGLNVDQERCSPAWAQGSMTLLTRLVENVIDNAVKHNEHGGWIRVETTVDGPVVRLTVENGGAVLAQDDVGQLARPFRRLGADRTGSARGTGLGLSIVRSIASAHGGSLELSAGQDGGLRVVATVPRAGTSRDRAPA